MYEEEDDRPNEKLDKIILKERERLEREKNEKKNSEKRRNSEKNVTAADVNKNKVKHSDSSTASSSKVPKNATAVSNDLDKPVASKRNSSPIPVPPVKRMKESKERTYKPFHKLLEGVVVVISGIQVRVQVQVHLSNLLVFLFLPKKNVLLFPPINFNFSIHTESGTSHNSTTSAGHGSQIQTRLGKIMHTFNVSFDLIHLLRWSSVYYFTDVPSKTHRNIIKFMDTVKL